MKTLHTRRFITTVSLMKNSVMYAIEMPLQMGLEKGPEVNDYIDEAVGE